VRIHDHGRRAFTVASLLTLASALPPSWAGDWPQLWGPAVTGAVDAPRPGSGVSLRELWRAGLGETYRGHDGSRDGPIATPAVAGGRVFMAGPHGLLVALDAGSGRELWRKDLLKELQAKAPHCGFGASPIVAADKVVVQVGGAEKRCVRASDGATVWEERTYPGSVALVDGHLLALSITAGLLRVVEASPQGYRERARLQVLEPGARAETPPSVVGRRIFVRNDEEVVAVDVEG